MASSRILPSVRSLHISQVHIPKRRGWDRCLSEAEKLVGFPSSFASLSTLMNEDVSNWAAHARRLTSSNHPFTTTLKRLVFHGRSRLQVRGLVSLLFARLTNDPEALKAREDFLPEFDILKNQRQLAETLELIYSAQYIHRSLMNLPNDLHSSEDSELKDDLLQLEFGNKIALLGGDYLLAQACMNLALMRSSMIVDIISRSLIDFTQSEFITKRDITGRHLPSKDQLVYKHWELRNSLSWAGLMANICKGSMSIGGHTEESLGHRFGLHFGLAHQAQMEIDAILECPVDGFDLSSLPVIYYFQENKDLLLSRLPVRGNQLMVDEVAWKEISHQILNSGEALEKTQDVIEEHCHACKKELKHLRNDDSKKILLKLIDHLTDI